MLSKFATRTNSLKILASFVGILGLASAFSLPAFSQSNASPSDAHTLPRGTMDAPEPNNADSNNIYPVDPARTNQTNTEGPNFDNQTDSNDSPSYNNEMNGESDSDQQYDSTIRRDRTTPRDPNLTPRQNYNRGDGSSSN